MGINDKVNSIKEYIDSIKEITIDELVEDNGCNDCFVLIDNNLIPCSYYKSFDFIEIDFDEGYCGQREFHLARKSWMTNKDWNDNLNGFQNIKGYCMLVYPDKRDNN